MTAIRDARMTDIRQGDLLLRRVESLPAGAEPADSVLARGETTGHAHRLKGEARAFRAGSALLVQVDGQAELVHEEHKAVSLQQGVYEVVRQREYDPIAERQVSD